MANGKIKEQLRNRIANYEHWISSGCKGNPPQNVQKELFELFKESPNTYTIYRNYLWSLLIGLDGESDELSEFLEFLNHSKSDVKFNEIVSFFETETMSSFDNKRMNVFEIVSEVSVQGLSQVSCFLYQSYYEIESILLLFASIASFNTKGSVNTELSNLRDKSGRLKKGVAVDFIKAKLKKYPILLSLFNSGYNVKLRNTIGHNSYRINGECIESLDSEIKVSKSEFFKSLYDLQKLNNFLIYFYSSNSLIENDFKDNGAISIGFGEDEEECLLYVFQLECFFNIDNEKKWFDNVIFTIENDFIRTTLPTKTPMKGKYDDRMKTWLEKQKKNNKLTVVFESIRPQMNEDDSIIETEYGNFAICGNQIEIKCDYEIKTTC
ncbi:hypothetical protein [Carboxylicivirga sp. N1Y90]|uniref:hypothetical protein n=1 Tax=Carboxylicivirga fragile TaxID=3417571 RepID=UPI003D325F40|nr:hypothetical protein [Marinilabiliaceae bacterium N1Y90]